MGVLIRNFKVAPLLYPWVGFWYDCIAFLKKIVHAFFYFPIQFVLFGIFDHFDIFVTTIIYIYICVCVWMCINNIHYEKEFTIFSFIEMKYKQHFMTQFKNNVITKFI